MKYDEPAVGVRIYKTRKYYTVYFFNRGVQVAEPEWGDPVHPTIGKMTVKTLNDALLLAKELTKFGDYGELKIKEGEVL